MAVLFLIAFLAMTVRDFRYFPGISALQEAFHVLCLIYLVLVYPLQKIEERRGLSAFEWYLIGLMAVVPFAQATAAWKEFAQPILYGALHERAIITLAGVLFCLLALRNRLFTLREVESALLILAWGSAIVYIVMNTAVDANRYIDRVAFTALYDGEAIFTPQVHFVIFGVLYYAFRGLRTGRIRNYLFALLLFAGAWGKRGGREMTVVLLLTFFIFAWRWTSGKRRLALIPKLIFGFAAVLSVYSALAPQQAAMRLSSFSDAFIVAFTGQEVGEVSADARIEETLFALPGIAKHPIFGNGALSVQWQGGPEVVQGAYFFAGDIGLLGALWQYGLIGLIYFSCQYWFAIRIVKGLPPGLHTPFIDAAKGYLLYFAIVSLTQGEFVYDAQASLLFIALLQPKMPDLHHSTSLSGTEGFTHYGTSCQPQA